jgi:hypothetical protein
MLVEKNPTNNFHAVFTLELVFIVHPLQRDIRYVPRFPMNLLKFSASWTLMFKGTMHKITNVLKFWLNIGHRICKRIMKGKKKQICCASMSIEV